MKINEKQFAAVLNLDGPKRYSHFIKVAADQGAVWGLFDAGCPLLGDDDGNAHFPLWPAKEYAEASAIGEWSSYSPRNITLGRLLGELLPNLREDGVKLAIFPTPQASAVTQDADQFETDIKTELSRIE